MTKTFIFIPFLALAFMLPQPLGAAEPTMCTMQYQPVCGTKAGVYQTFGNGCVLGAEGAVYQHEGECTAAELSGKQEGTYTPPAHCTAWFDGCNSCGRGQNGESFCTMMACMDTPRAGYCTSYGETSTTPTPDPDTSVSSSVTVTNTAPAEEPSTVEPVEASDEEIAETTPGFFVRIWTNISAWFAGLF